jgi:hypothetical protein
MSTIEHRVAAVRRYLETNAVPSQVSTTDQLELLLFFGNHLGLYDAVDCVRSRILEQESPASRYNRLRQASDAAEASLEAEYLPRIQKLLAEGDLEGAGKLARELPSDSVTWVFAQDNIRQATKKT